MTDKAKITTVHNSIAEAEALIRKANNQACNAVEALQYSQAACNVANAAMLLEQMKSTKITPSNPID